MKIVYTLVSSEKDIYLEQALVSAYSCRLHNPEAEIILMVDLDTDKTLVGCRAEIDKYISRRLVVECPNSLNNKEKSRFLKTSIRQQVTGNFLFIDCDTVICASLDEVETIDADVAMVPDTHTKYRDYPFYRYMTQLMKTLYSVDVSRDSYYFNSGVMYVRDTPVAHRLFELWHVRWEESRVKGTNTDQQALFMANHEMGNVIRLLSGTYNCQIGLSVQYFHEARILHYFNSQMLSKTDFSPFFMRSFYESVKKDGRISEQTSHWVRTAKTQFSSPTMIVGRNEMDFLMCVTGKGMMQEFLNRTFTYHLVTFIIKAKRKLRRMVGR